MKILLEVLALVIGQVLSALPDILWNLREKASEGIEIDPDPDLDGILDRCEWLS